MTAQPMRWTRVRAVLATLVLIAIAMAARAWADTTADPRVKRLRSESARLAPGSPPVRILLMADIHVAGPDMPPSRLSRIVARANRLHPDLVLIAGDFVSEKRTATHIYAAREAIAPLDDLDARLGKFAVFGNHDHWFHDGALAGELRSAGFTVMNNGAVQAGPIALGGLDDAYTGRDDMTATVAAMAGLNGPRVVLSHSPDAFPAMPADFGLMLAGHTHCGQIRYPWGGAPATMSKYGDRYACDVMHERGDTLVTSAGIGTSLLPLRMFAPPDMWLIEIVPRAVPD